MNPWPLVLAGVMSLGPVSAAAQSMIRGRVVDSEGRELTGIAVEVVGTRIAALSGSDGRYLLVGVPAGSHQMSARGIGFRPARQAVTVDGKEPTTIDWVLVQEPVALAEIVVTPGRIGVDNRLSTATLSKEVIATLPQLGEDPYRSVTRLPGVAASEYSSSFWVRGGPERELLTRLDGADLIEPFHLKDFDAALSIIDAGTIAKLDLISGGFTAEFGDRLTGVLSMKTLRASDKALRTSLGVSITSLRGSSQGTFAGGKGRWLAAARHGYLDVVLKLINTKDDLSPRYNDVSAKVEYQLGARHTLSAHFLHADDAVDFTAEGDPTLESGYRTNLGWLGWKGGFGERLEASTIVAVSRLGWSRHGDGEFDPEHPLFLRDNRAARLLALRQDWTLTPTATVLLKWGFGLERRQADYAYRRDNGEIFVRNDSVLSRTDSVRTTLDPRGTVAGLYGAVRVRPTSRLALEVGGRYDRHGYLAAGRVGPRLNAALDLGAGTTLRAAWGKHYQAPGIHEIQVQDGVTEFPGIEGTEQRTIGLERFLPSGIGVRVEGYHRRYADLNPVYLNVRNTSLVFPEVEDDRIRVDRTTGRSSGIELLLQRRGRGRLEWAASYGYAIAEDRSGGIVVPRSRDQRHTINLDMSYAPNPKWRVSWGWQYHSGWPFTTATITYDTIPGRRFLVETIQYGAPNGDRMPAYRRLDLRATRDFVMRKTTVRVYFDLFNALKRRNVRGYDYYGRTIDGQVVTWRRTNYQLTRIPSLGVSVDW